MGLGVVTLAVTVAVVGASVWHWEFLAGNESPSAAIGNLVLVAGAVVGLPLAVWRSVVAHQQLEVARLGQANERYQKGAEMLSGRDLHGRLGGI